MAMPLHLEVNLVTLFDMMAAGGAGVSLASSAIRAYYVSGDLGIWVQAGGTTPRLKVLLQGAPSDTAAEFATAEGADPVLLITDTNPHIVNLPQVNMPCLRLLVQDTAGNGANTDITIKLYTPRPRP